MKFFKSHIFYLLFILGFCHCNGETLADESKVLFDDEKTLTEQEDVLLNGGFQQAEPAAENPYPGHPVGILTFEEVQSREPDDIWTPPRVWPYHVPHFENLSEWPLEELTPEQFDKVISLMDVYDEKYRPEGYFKDITIQQMKKIPPEHFIELGPFEEFPKDEFDWNYLRYFSPEQVKVLSPEQIKPIGKYFGRKHIAVFNLEQIKAIGTAMTLREKELIPPEFFPHFSGSAAAINAAACEQASYITTEQMAEARLSYFSARVIGCLSLEQLKALDKSSAYISVLSNAQIKQLSPEQLKVLPQDYFLTPYDLKVMTTNQLSVLDYNGEVAQILYLTKRSDEKTTEFFSNRDRIKSVSKYIQFFRPHQFKLITEDHVWKIPGRVMIELTPERIANFPAFVYSLGEPFQTKLSKEQIQAIIPETLKNIYNAGLVLFSPEQTEFFTKEQLLNLSEKQ